ncbi:hypothetical protein TCAL_05965 [Tigriopus californicus]|uniref:Uncharacterized protein n=1 Tax=Tigriopus californicus TaxID=6832 RepID=A0A553NNQ9_TIGCA|nr:uncharacterized protein LOC131879246 [Tigriopus californicus]TRY67079.1 hypothetical protein TCAL_05965 [Tigriopus californicus]|eukprot:TCALIF_05965-PA protein Name:"Protein of unknown function" AED:0.00 eAED:0.00 QI:159/1/1/1/1/1/2/8/251
MFVPRDVESGTREGLLFAENGQYTITEVITVLTSFRQNHERLKLYRVSLSVIRFLSILNFVYTLLGVTLLMLAMSSDLSQDFTDAQRDQFFRIGMAVSIFAPFASMVDLLALRGLQSWRRTLLLPWLFLYSFVISLIFANALSGVFHHGLKWTYIVLMLCVMVSFSAWRHVRLQYTEMAKDRPTCQTIEELAADLRRTREAQVFTTSDPLGDFPPKYEDLEQPPVYEDSREEPTPVHAREETTNALNKTES